jgi:hypothetical protein
MLDMLRRITHNNYSWLPIGCRKIHVSSIGGDPHATANDFPRFATPNTTDPHLSIALGKSNRAQGERVKYKTIKKRTDEKHIELCTILGGEDEGFEYESLPRVKPFHGGRRQTCVPYEQLVDRLQAMDEEGLDTSWNGAD